MKTQWQTFTVEQEKRFSKWREVKTLISKRGGEGEGGREGEREGGREGRQVCSCYYMMYILFVFHVSFICFAAASSLSLSLSLSLSVPPRQRCPPY